MFYPETLLRVSVKVKLLKILKIIYEFRYFIIIIIIIHNHGILPDSLEFG